MNRLFSWIDRVATLRRLAVLTVLEVVLLGCENGLDFPLSVPFMRHATGHPYLDMCAFCSAAEIHTQLGDFGEAGRRLQLLIMPTVDIAIPVVSCAFGSVALAVLLRGRTEAWTRWLRAVPLAAMVLDFAENAGIIALVVGYPRQLDGVATVTGVLSGLKSVAYAATLLAIIALTAFVLVARARHTKLPTAC